MSKVFILFADNDPDFLKTRSEFLEQEGYKVIKTIDMVDARKKFEAEPIDLAIIDVRLEDDDDEKDNSGLILAEEFAHSVPIIILTGFPTVAQVREALLPQPDGIPIAVEFLEKSQGAEDMIQAVTSMTSMKSADDRRLKIKPGFRENVESKKRELRDFYEKKMNSYSSIAKYVIALLSFLIVVFPSTYTFIKPPYNYDYLLLIAFFSAVISLILNCFVIFLVEFRKGSDPLNTHKLCFLAVVFTLISLGVIFYYIVYNVTWDRLSPPRIIAIEVSPHKIKSGDVVELRGKARDDDVDDLMWTWTVVKLTEKGKPEKLKSNLATVYWHVKNSGKYYIEAVVCDDRSTSRKERVMIVVY